MFTYAVPAYVSFEPRTIFFNAQPNKDRAAHNMIFRHETPITTVGAIVAIVAHHPIVVHLELVLLADADRAVLIRPSYAGIDRIVSLRNHDAVAFAGDINRTVIVACPVGMPQRIDIAAVSLGFYRNSEDVWIFG